MYPARFEYHAPASLEDALELLDRYGDEGKVLAGGQSLIPFMKLRFASPGALVDINRIEGLDSIQEENGFLSIGALVRHKDCERSDALKGRYGVLADAAPQISDPVVRNRGTVVGSLAHADPQGDWGSALLAAGAQLEVVSSGGTRSDPADGALPGPVHYEPRSRTRSRRPSRSPIPAVAQAARISSSSGRSATSPPSASPSTSRSTTARSGARASRSRASAPATCGPKPPRSRSPAPS